MLPRRNATPDNLFWVGEAEQLKQLFHHVDEVGEMMLKHLNDFAFLDLAAVRQGCRC